MKCPVVGCEGTLTQESLLDMWDEKNEEDVLYAWVCDECDFEEPVI